MKKKKIKKERKEKRKLEKKPNRACFDAIVVALCTFMGLLLDRSSPTAVAFSSRSAATNYAQYTNCLLRFCLCLINSLGVALALAQRGISCTVFERDASFAERRQVGKSVSFSFYVFQLKLKFCNCGRNLQMNG